MVDVIQIDNVHFVFFLFGIPIPERVRTGRAQDQDTFGIHHLVIFMCRTGVEGVRFGIAMGRVGLADASDARMRERVEEFLGELYGTLLEE